MSITIKLNQDQVNKEEKLNLHFLPAKVYGDGHANVDTYFNNYTSIDNNILSNSLRGYPLQGVELNVPIQYKALVLQESNNSCDIGERTLRVSGNFEKFTYWNYDKVPSKADAYIQALKWKDLAAELAKPVPEAEVLAEAEAQKKEGSLKENESA